MLELSMIWGIHNNRNVILHILLCFVVGGRNSEYTDYTLALGMFLSGEKTLNTYFVFWHHGL